MCIPERVRTGRSGAWGRMAGGQTRSFPATVHPEPLLGMPENEPLEDGIVHTCVRADRLINVVTLHQRESLVEPEHVVAIRLTPRRCRNHWCPGRKRNSRKASKRPGWMTEELHHHTVPATGVLVEDEYDDILSSQPI